MKRHFKVREICNKYIEDYPMYCTEEEMKKWCKMKREANGYIKGVGGDRSYECFAILSDSELYR